LSTRAGKDKRGWSKFGSLTFSGQREEGFKTPSAKRKKEFAVTREQDTKDLFEMFNKTIFQNKLPADLEITWSKTLR
jgi:hypothetical protein